MSCGMCPNICVQRSYLKKTCHVSRFQDDFRIVEPWTYHSVFPLVSLPPMLAKFTTRPLAILTSGRNVLVISISPHRFTSAVRLNILIGAQSIGSMYPIPALFTSPHSPPAQEEILNDCIKSRRVIRRAVFFVVVYHNNSRLVKWSRS